MAFAFLSFLLPLLAAEALEPSGGAASLSGEAAVLGWGAVALAIVASVVVAARIWQCEARGGTVVPGRPWPPVAWTGAAVLFIACGWLLVAAFCVSLLSADAPLLDRMAAQAAGSIVATLAVVAGLRAHGASWRSIGLSSDDAAVDWRLAIGGLGLVTGPLLLISAALDRLVTYEHPVIDTLQAEHGPGTIAIVVITAVIAAPIAEELFFRRILLGWIDARVPSTGGSVAILASALLFGLSHWGQGLAWIPLVFLGIALGELAWRRGSLMPAILLHALFNAVSVVMLVVQIASGTMRPPG
jgi:membrane protease YdiL (CAAX protease family)